ncbi:protein OS-9-like isoform X1 [Sinocyclocheilus anshuiensis]|uniref:Endoplasmic reticulum lectin n=1 Tax=Sinocyclocheilus anshuiensis TaxID=1608454 RepID=A0A671M044_9TELE|nr:PREDICTED: protein OS-9-like isoform X1 [Sinocyclocheilus anshuiensis]
MASSLIKWLRGLYVFFLTCLLSVLAFLNLEELNEMKYGIQILPDPVIMGQMEDVMLVSNKYKQLYECRLPAQAMRFHQDPVSEPDVQGYSGLGVPDLLKPMQTAPCLVKTKDWWTYEFCYGQHIRQYHLEDSEIKGDVLFLGYYDSEFDWTNETAKASKQHKLKRYHSQSYVNGSKCDLNGNPRETEVRFVCEEGSSDYIARVDEPQSCRYVLTVHTSRTCQHPLLRPPSTAKPQGIVCQPALSAQQYMDYVNAQVSDTKRKVEQISEELKNLDEILSKDDKNKGLQDDKTDEEPVVHSDEPPLSESETKEDEVAEGGLVREEPEDKDFWEGVTKPASTESSTDSEEPQDSQLHENDIFGEEKFNFKIITDPADLMKFVQHLRESNQKNRKAELEKEIQQSSQKKEEQEEEKREERAAGREVEEEEGDEDETLLQEFEDEMADQSVPSSKIEEIKEEMQKEFDNIIEEAQQELENEGLKGEFDRSQATQTLENTLGKLLDRLEDKTGHESQLETEKNTEMHKSTHTQHKTEGGPSAGSPNLVPKTPAQAGSSGEQVKVRVTKYKVGGGVAAGAVTGGNDDDDGGEGGVKVKELGEGDPQWQQIQEVVKEQLERAGIKAEGKIEVKILTRKTAEEAGDQWLTEEDTKSFRELLINLLTGGTEEVYKEQKRQQDLENNYKFVWGEKQEENQSTGNSDSDETDF